MCCCCGWSCGEDLRHAPAWTGFPNDSNPQRQRHKDRAQLVIRQARNLRHTNKKVKTKSDGFFLMPAVGESEGVREDQRSWNTRDWVFERVDGNKVKCDGWFIDTIWCWNRSSSMMDFVMPEKNDFFVVMSQWVSIFSEIWSVVYKKADLKVIQAAEN